MRLSIKSLINLFLFLFLYGCSINNIDKSKNKSTGFCKAIPTWAVNVPYSQTNIYGVGIAGENFHGFNYQRRLAISRAINEIAMQMNVKVDSVLYDTKNSEGYNFMKTISFQTVDNQKVNAKIIKSCINPYTGELYILMISKKGTM